MLEEMGFSKARDCLGYRIIVKNIERLADHAVALSQDILDYDSLVPEKVIDKIQEMSDFTLDVIDNMILPTNGIIVNIDYKRSDKSINSNQNYFWYKAESDFYWTLSQHTLRLFTYTHSGNNEIPLYLKTFSNYLYFFSLKQITLIIKILPILNI